MKKILFLSRSVPPCLTQRTDVDYIIKNLISKNWTVDIYDPKTRCLLNCNNKTKINFINNILLDRFKIIRIILNFFVLIYFSIINKGKYDITQIQYIRGEYFLIPKLITAIGKKNIASVFGSDVNNKATIKRNMKLWWYFDIINFTNPSLGDHFFANKSSQLANKIRNLQLPEIRLNYIENPGISSTAFREKYDIPGDNKIIVLGTYFNELEQQKQLLKAISRADINKYPITFVIPRSYSYSDSSSEYTNAERNELVKKQLGVKYSYILLDYLEEEENAQLRKATDVFINIRKKDQMAASMLESIYAGAIVINGAWLPYEYLEELGIKYLKVEDIDDVVSTLTKLLRGESCLNSEAINKNKILMKNVFSPEESVEKWNQLYQGLV